ncbi:uncharacterized protein LOC126728120 [Quercus robur]|uniref:uncharacterized protein LOC126728120 n=1 Tax=Quercus robur TaxID=38942 RepID=UPI002163E733|nr:uncharacterized protein LOC126728120 [Quercus robur]
MRDFRSDKYNNNRPRRDFTGKSRSTTPQVVNTVFQEPVHQVLEKIKNEPYFKWPNKMGGNLMRRNQSLHCQYHRNEGIPPRIIELCGIIWSNWSKMGGYNSFCIGPIGKETKQDQGLRGMLLRGLLWAQLMSSLLLLGKLDKIGTIQPHNDAFVITFRIGGYDVKRVLVDQGNGAKIMYPDLYKGLNLKSEDLTTYDSPLVSFDGKVIIPRGQIRMPVQASSKVVEVDFIVVDAYSPYTAIMARPWLHALGAVSSTLHLKVKYLWGTKLKMWKKAKCERMKEVVINGDSEKFFQVGAQLPPREKEELLAFLRRNIDVFT